MAILPITSVNQNNINFTANQNNDKKQSNALKNTLITAGTVGVGALAYKKNWIQKGIKWLSETNFMKNKAFPKYEKDDAKFMAGVGVASIVAKDGLGCYLYVKQSLNNDKIPEDKRKFVAALDLANGGLMIAMQLLMFFTISNKMIQAKMFDKLFGKFFTRSANKSLMSKLGNTDKFNGMTGKDFHQARLNDKKGLEKAFSYLTSLAAATLLAKRVIVPFIATPLADKTKAWMCRNDKPIETHKDTENTYDTTKPAAEKTDDKNTQFAGTQEQSTNLLENIKKTA